MAPIHVNPDNEQMLLNTVYNNLNIYKPSQFHVDDYVRISKYKNIFEKGYTPNFSTEIVRIRSIRNTNPSTYLLEDYQRNPLKGGFYNEEILRTHHSDVYIVEKIIKTNGQMAYVKCLGFPDEHNSCFQPANGTDVYYNVNNVSIER
ncbi:uncharacterized protein LOC142228573 [Haematobia irritans]|uniref:uncharacterized protein LOC142228573 n=1 Tax=Haematobia irritans TaxID=7368 RepID=UPI003F4F4B18